MKQEHFEYVKSNLPDPAPHKSKLCHSDMITCIIMIAPEEPGISTEQFKRKMKYATSSRDGKVKIWNAHTMVNEQTIQVTKEEKDGKKDPSKKIWVTSITYMTHSKRLVAASANRMISFYDLGSTNYSVPTSRIEGLVGIPLCMEYYRWPKNKDGKFETLLVGDDLGICHSYNFTSNEWHMCEYKIGSSDPNMCHAHEIEHDYKNKVEAIFNENEDKKRQGRKQLNKGLPEDE